MICWKVWGSLILETLMIYANDADLLNEALFGTTAKKCRLSNPELKGNIRNFAAIK
jgi:hypothetical protein